MKKILRAVKNEWNEYNDGEILVRDLTKNDHHPPNPESLQRLNELAKDLYSSPSIYQMLNKRLHDLDYLMHIEKSLIVVEYLLKHCDTRFVRFMKMQTDYIKRLRGLKYMVPINEVQKVDKAQIVRRRANRIYTLLVDDDELEKQRCAAQGKQYVPKSTSTQHDTTSNDLEQSNEPKKRPQQPPPLPPQPSNQQESQQNITNNNKKKNNSGNDDKISNDNKKNHGKHKNNEVNKNNNEDLFADFINIHDSSMQTNFNNNNVDNTNDLIPEDWLKEFANIPNSGTGQDGTALFSFGNDEFSLEDNNDDNNKNDNDGNNHEQHQKQESEEWMTQLTNFDNLLNSPRQQKKLKSQGKTLSQMAQESRSVDNPYVSSSGNTQNTFNPYTTYIPPQSSSTNNVFSFQSSKQQNTVPFAKSNSLYSNSIFHSNNNAKDPFSTVGN